MNTGGSPSIGMPAYLISTPDIMLLPLDRNYNWGVFCVRVCVYVHVLKISPPCTAFILSARSNLLWFYCEVPDRSWDKSKRTWTSGEGEARNEDKRTGREEEREAGGHKKRDFNVLISFLNFMYAAHYTIMSFHLELCLWLCGLWTDKKERKRPSICAFCSCSRCWRHLTL